jgi:hypothetical protein
MKRKLLYFVMLVAVLGFVTIQSCKKDEVVVPKEYQAAMPEAPVPAVDGIVPFTGTGQAINLEWTASATNAIKWDVYFGDTETPDQVATGLSTNAYTAHVTKGGTYYWQVVTTDANKVESDSPVWSFQVNSNPAAPALTAPANNATAVSNAASLTWTATDPEDDDLTFDVYFGTTATPAPVKTGVTDLTFTPTLAPSTTYYWKIVAKDPFGGSSTSAVYSFTTGALPVVKFVANFDVAETSVQNGAYAYVNAFTKVDNSTIQATNWWDSGWTAKFVLDFVKNTIVMTPFTAVSGANTYICTGSGKINQTTGEIDLVYSVTKNGVLLENGTEIFTIKTAKSLSMDVVNKQPKL